MYNVNDNESAEAEERAMKSMININERPTSPQTKKFRKRIERKKERKFSMLIYCCYKKTTVNKNWTAAAEWRGGYFFLCNHFLLLQKKIYGLLCFLLVILSPPEHTVSLIFLFECKQQLNINLFCWLTEIGNFIWCILRLRMY